MKLNENNAKYAVVRTAFHGGGAISFHTSINAAEKAMRKSADKYCQCGCCDVVDISTYKNLREYNPDMHYSTLCK